MERYPLVPDNTKYIPQKGNPLTTVRDQSLGQFLGSRNDAQMRATTAELQRRVLSNTAHAGVSVPRVPNVAPLGQLLGAAGVAYELARPTTMGNGTVEHNYPALWQQIQNERIMRDAINGVYPEAPPALPQDQNLYNIYPNL